MAMKTFRVLTVVTLLSLSTPSHACPLLCTCSDTRVDCYGKDLTEIPADLPLNAVYIDLQTNHIERVDDQFQNLSSVEKVMLRFNKISFLSEGAFSNMPNLVHVNLGSNLITTLGPGVFQHVPKMKTLDLTNNQIKTIEGSFENLPSLTKLVLTRNKVEQLTEDGLKPLTNLVYLMVEENRLSRATPTSFHALKKLSYVSLAKNPLTTMNDVLSENVLLSYLDLSECQLETVPTGLPWAIRYLQLSKNNISKVYRDTFRETQFLGIVILDENDLSEVEPGAFSRIVHLEQIWLNGNRLTTFPSPIPSTVHTVSIEENEITEVTNSDFPESSKMTLLSLKGNKINSIEPFAFSRLTKLKKLYLGGNAITELKEKSFSGLRNLTELEISRNPITHIDTRFAAGLHGLELLDLSFVEDTEPFVKGNFFRDVPYLQTLKLRFSPSLARHVMTSNETLKSFYHLQNLDLRDNNLQSLETDLPRFFPNLKSAQLARNAWVCDSRLLWLHDWMQRQPDIFVDKEEVLCAMPMHLAGAAIADLPYHDFFHTTTISTTDDDFGSGEVTADFNDDSSRSSIYASITDESLLLVSTSVSSPMLKTSQSAADHSDEGSQSEVTVEDITTEPSTKSSSDSSGNSKNNVVPFLTSTPASTTSEKRSSTPDVHTQPTALSGKTVPPKTTTLFPSKTTTPYTKGLKTTSEPQQPSSTNGRTTTSSLRTVSIDTSPPSSRTRSTGHVTRLSTTSTSTSATRTTSAGKMSVATSTTTHRMLTTSVPGSPTTSVETAETKPTASTTKTVRTPTTPRIFSTSTPTTTTTTTTTTSTTTTSKRTTTPSPSPDSDLNDTGERSPSVKGHTSTNRNAGRNTTTRMSKTTATPVTTSQRSAAVKTTVSTETAPTITSISTSTPTPLPNHTSPHPTTTSITTTTTNDNDHPEDVPRYGGSQNRMPSITDASGPTRTTAIAVSVSIIALIVLLIATAFVLRHRRQIQLLYQRRFTYTIEHSDTAFVLADQDDPDTLSQAEARVMTPRYRSMSEEEPGSRVSVKGGDHADGVAMFM